MKNKVCEALGIQYPIIMGAMAYASLAPLVAAVSEAGGLGILGSGFMSVEVLDQQVKEVRSKTDRPFGTNLFLDPDLILDEQCKVVLDHKVPVAYLDTLELLDYDYTKRYYDMLREGGCKIVAKINCLHDALVAEKAGADVIITKGMEGGGHKAKISAMVLLAEVVEHVHSVPIVASGGIATPRQAAGCIVMGAQGVEMGSAFIATNESTVHQNTKDAILKCQDIDIVVLRESTGEPSWQIRNEISDRLQEIEWSHPRAEAAKLVRDAARGALRNGMAGDVVNGSVMIGQAGSLVHEIVPVSKLVGEFCDEVEKLLQKTYSLNL